MNGYRTHVSNRRVGVGLALITLAVTALIALSNWLLPPAGSTPPLPAPAPAAPAPSPGAVACPTADELAAASAPLRPTASDLIDCPDLYDGRTVTYVGEAIEATFPLDARTVVILNDDDYALGPGPLPEARTALGGNSGIAVVLPPGTAGRIQQLGDYRHRGDRLEVVGVYHSASDLLGGEPAIVARDATVVEAGYAIAHTVDAKTAIAAAIAAGTAAAMAAIELRRRR